MSRRAPRPTAILAPLLSHLSALDAARAIAHPPENIEKTLERLAVDRARLVVDVYEERAAQSPERKSNGVFYTPPEVVEAMLDRLPLEGVILDPAAGAGAFVLAIARRVGLSGLSRVHACDIDASALAACALALETHFGPAHRAEIRRWAGTNTHACDVLREPLPAPAPDLVVGNPPYGLNDAPDLGGRFPELDGEIDLFACFLLRSLALTAPEGRVALLVPDTWLTNARAAALRQVLLERSDLERLVDFGKPFASARDTRVHAVVLHRGATGCAVESTRQDRLLPMAPASAADLRESAPRGWFLYRTTDEVRACAALEAASRPLSERFDVVYGLRTGSNEKHVRAGEGAVPLIGGLDLDAFDRHVAPRHLVDAAPFERALAKQRGRWKLGIQRIRTNSRVSWRRWLEAAPLTPSEVGLDSLTLVAPKNASEALSDELCAMLGVLNSSVLNRWYRLSFTDVNVKPVYVAALPIPPLPRELARAVRMRLEMPGNEALERAIDRLVADAYGLDERTLTVLEEGFWGDELERRPMPSRDEALRWVRVAA